MIMEKSTGKGMGTGLKKLLFIFKIILMRGALSTIIRNYIKTKQLKYKKGTEEPNSISKFGKP